MEPSPSSTNDLCFWLRTVRTDPIAVTVCSFNAEEVDKIVAISGFVLRRVDESLVGVAAAEFVIVRVEMECDR